MKNIIYKLFLLFAFLGVTYSVSAQSAYNGCPDFMDISASYVETYVGETDNPFEKDSFASERHNLIVEQGVDQNTGGQLSFIPNGEVKSVRIGNDDIGGESEALVYHFTVDPENTLLFVNFAVVLEDPGHDFEFQPRFVVRVTDKEGRLVSECSEYDVSAAAGIEGFQDYSGRYTMVRWRDWSKFGLDLSPYAGEEVQVQFITYDCFLYGHFGYAYFTAHCAPNKIAIENCSAEGFSISAPEGFAKYKWDNGDTTQTSFRKAGENATNIYCEITSVTGCTFTQSAYIDNSGNDGNSFYIDTICQGQPYKKHNFDLPPQYNVGTTNYYITCFDPASCAETGTSRLQLTVLQSYFDIEATLCEGEDYKENGFNIIQPPVGVLFDTLRYYSESMGCDSMVCLKLTISQSLNLPNSIIGNKTPCTNEMETYFIEGDDNLTKFVWEFSDNVKLLSGNNSPQIKVYFTDDKPAEIILKGVNGCGTGAVPFEVRPRISYTNHIKDTICVNQVYDKYGFLLGEMKNTGKFSFTNREKTTFGCDSIVVLSLVVLNNPTLSVEVIPDKSLYCSSERVLLNAKGDGDYIIHGCDSLKVTLGDIYCSDGTIVKSKDYVSSGKQGVGVVYHVDYETGIAYVMDKSDKYRDNSLVWSEELVDIENLKNHSKAREILEDIDGFSNTMIIRNSGDKNAYPLAWDIDVEEGWYLPSIGELRWLFAALNEVNPSLKLIGGQTMRMGENEGDFIYYSSTEYSDSYVLCIDETVNIIGYFKGNKVASVRQTRTVKLNNIEQPKYKIGDVITCEDGKKGVVYYLAPDGMSGEIVLLYDMTGRTYWSRNFTDIPELENRGRGNIYGMYLDAITSLDGKKSTEIIQDFAKQTSTWHPAAGNMKYFGYYLPTVGQMNRIFAHSSIIDQVAIANGGDELSFKDYWTSDEFNEEYGWYFSMIYGYPDIDKKDQNMLIRPIRYFVVCEPEIEYLESNLTYKWSSGEVSPYLNVMPETTTNFSVTVTTNEGCSTTSSKTLVVQQAEKVVYDRTICSGEVYQDDYFNESESGYYEKIIENDECNQIIGLNLKVIDSEGITKIVDNSCQGGTYTKHGFSFTPTVVGVIYDTLYLKNQAGCDSIIALELNVLPMSRDTIFAKVCQNEAYDQNDFSIPPFQPAGTNYFERIESNNNQCPYILTLALSVDSLYQISIVDSACQASPYKKNGFDVIPESVGYNNYYLNLKSTAGCDSTVALNLRVLERFETIYNDTIILGEKYQSKDFDLPEQLEMGTHQFKNIYTSQTGCDSIIVLNLTVLNDEGIFIPNSFTPLDANGKNDHFMEGYELYIYDRYGLLMCHTTDGWDGKYRGEYADPGVYVYTLIYKSGKEKHGVVEILK
jgi:hypothetical protein